MISDQLKDEIRSALPDNHPIIEKLDNENGKTDYQVLGMVADLVDTLDDWQRGIRTWEEVDEKLVLVRDEVKETT